MYRARASPTVTRVVGRRPASASSSSLPRAIFASRSSLTVLRCQSCLPVSGFFPHRHSPGANHSALAQCDPTKTFSALPRAARTVSYLHMPARLGTCSAEGLPGIDGYAAELGLASELPAAIGQYKESWIEHGVAERAYALQCPDDFAAIVGRYGHKALEPKQYTASAFLAGVLGVLSKRGTVLYHLGPATGRWSYNVKISWWSVAPAPDWDSARLSWADSGDDSVSYIPGAHGR